MNVLVNKQIEYKLYHGVSKKVIFPSLESHIKGPFSTTTSYAVAFKFSQPRGLIIEFNSSNSGKQLDCSWFSDYPAEEEIFTLGGLSKVIFQKIIDVTNSIDHHLYQGNATNYISYDYWRCNQNQISKIYHNEFWTKHSWR